ncbi:unnamed protein product [Prorocentrum cordatum]|uniref:CTP synthase n=1 Tax=Prorocentrum cordatum TaxID=2364126 RepID=A0ABN9TTF4_9DINO|nr:unnamed protein product [Polarella glacialis]
MAGTGMPGAGAQRPPVACTGATGSPPRGPAGSLGSLAGGGPGMKYVVITGGTISGLGKGTTISSVGVVLKSHGLRVTAIKIDPYLNIDAGTMSPYEHGEVYVLEDGGEADLDLGNYERFLGLTLTSGHSMTSGKVYDQVIKRERTGHYLGKTVQMVPHVTDAIQDWITDVARKSVDGSGAPPQVCLVELGGTVGDIESAIYLEALQQFKFRVGDQNLLMIHLGMVPTVGATNEQKTKPCQHSVKLLREAGLNPDLLMCRCDVEIDEATRNKLSLFCQVPPEMVISLHDVSNLYQVPLLLAEQAVGQLICKQLGLGAAAGEAAGAVAPTLPLGAGALPASAATERLADWQVVADRVEKCKEEVSIALVGKYTGNPDAYVSVVKALQHAAVEAGLRLVISWVDSCSLQPGAQKTDQQSYEDSWEKIRSAQGVLVPGGFGGRGIEGKIACESHCRETKKPFLGICVGLQSAVIEFARNELGWEDANSTEFDEETPNPVVVFLPEASATMMGGTMRLGSRATIIRDRDSLACRLYPAACGKPCASVSIDMLAG